MTHVEDIFPKLIPKQCEICKSTTNLSRCGGCLAYFYCNRSHQLAGRQEHKDTCNTVKKARQTVQEEEQKLRQSQPNAFDTWLGSFWTVRETRPYMQAKMMLSETLIRTYHRQGIDDALANFLDMLRLSRSDNRGIRLIAGPLFLRVGQDQECYDFLKWWAIKSNDQNGYDWHDTSLPYLDIKDADVLEPIDVFLNDYAMVIPLVTLLLIKVRLLLEIQAVEKVREILQPHATPERIMKELDGLLLGNCLRRRVELVDNEEEHLNVLSAQIGSLLTAVGDANPHIIPMLLEPDLDELMGPPLPYTRGSKSEALLGLQYTYSAWCESAGAIQGLRNVIRTAIQDLRQSEQ